MTKARINAIAVILQCLFATIARAVDDTAYAINLSTRAKVGQSYSTSVKAASDSSAHRSDSSDAKPIVITHFQAEFEGTGTILAVSRFGEPTEVEVKVSDCTKNGAELFKSGTIIRCIDSDGRGTYMVNGRAATVEEQQALYLLIRVAGPDAPGADEGFGSKRPRKVGEIWPANVDELAKRPNQPYSLTGKDFEGQAKLIDAKAVDGHLILTFDCTTEPFA